MQALIAWLVLAALHFAPPAKHRVFPGHEETAEQALARYTSIATDIATAVEGRKDAKDRAALMLAWGIGETGLYHDADKGPCWREGVWKTRCDGGLAAGIWQMHTHRDPTSGKWLSVEEIFGDRARAARTATTLISKSLKSCTHVAAEDQLSAFGLGRCVSNNRSVRARYKLWNQVRAWEPPPAVKEAGPSVGSMFFRFNGPLVMTHPLACGLPTLGPDRG